MAEGMAYIKYSRTAGINKWNVSGLFHFKLDDWHFNIYKIIKIRNIKK